QISTCSGMSSHPCTTPAGMMMMSPGLGFLFYSGTKCHYVDPFHEPIPKPPQFVSRSAKLPRLELHRASTVPAAFHLRPIPSQCNACCWIPQRRKFARCLDGSAKRAPALPVGTATADPHRQRNDPATA